MEAAPRGARGSMNISPPPLRERRHLRTAFPPATRSPVHPPLRALPVCEIGRRRACGAHPVRAERGVRDASWRSGRGTYPNGLAARPSDATNTRTDRRASPSPRRAPSACPPVAHALRARPRSAASRSRESLGAFLRRPVVPQKRPPKYCPTLSREVSGCEPFSAADACAFAAMGAGGGQCCFPGQ